jgi:tRNA dimethylallyltransferase
MLNPLIVIVGETASGKTELAIDLALKFNGEIISADSRTLYRGMDIGTAKPTKLNQKTVRHHLLDVAEPCNPITVADYKILADQAIEDVLGRNKTPILVGGSGLYVDSVIFDYKFNLKADKHLREKLNSLSLAELQNKLFEKMLPMPININNKRYLIRQIETKGKVKKDNKLRENTLVIGLKTNNENRNVNIKNRVKKMLEIGLEQEARKLGSKYGWEIEPMHSIGYREFSPKALKSKSLSEIEEEIVRNTINYSKRQRTWFKRNKNIHWVNKQIECVEIITTYLNK